MARMFVNVEALNLRTAAGPATQATFKTTLHLGQEVDVSGDPVNGWIPISVVGSAEPLDGFVKTSLAPGPQTGATEIPSLREPTSSAREALVAAAIQQWERFKFGQGNEATEPFFRFVGEMWHAIGLSHDGHDVDIPWSSAAISFMVRQAATSFPKYLGFKFAASHSRYINDAIKNSGKKTAPFWGLRLHERKPQLGDIVVRSREQPITFELAAATNTFRSHGDIVVSIRPDELLAIGGNVSDSVSVTRYTKTPAGFVDSSKGVFALLVNNAG